MAQARVAPENQPALAACALFSAADNKNHAGSVGCCRFSRIFLSLGAPLNLEDYLDVPIAFHRVLIKVGAGVTGALLLGQALYWSKRTKSHDGWFYKTVEEWTDEIGLSRYEQEGARAKLKEIGVLEELKRGVPCRTFFRVNKPVLESILNGGQSTLQFGEIPPTSRGKKPGLVRGKSPDLSAANQPTKTKTTKVTTSKITNTPPGAYPDDFESAWRAYPDRPGGSKKDSFKAWAARVKEGATPEALKAGVERYARYCMAMRTEPQYIKQPQTFFGPGEHYKLAWDIPLAGGRKDKFDPVAYLKGSGGKSHETDREKQGDSINGEFERVD